MFTRAEKVLYSQAVARHANPCPTELSAMKQRILATALLLIVPTIIAAQTQTRDRKSNEGEQSQATDTNSVRNRVVGPKVSNHAGNQTSRTDPKPGTTPAQNPGQPTWGNSAFIVRPSSVERPQPAKSPAPAQSADEQQTVKRLVQPTSLISGPVKSENTSPRAVSSARSLVPTATYNVGIGDVLDVRLANMPTRESTLFTVLRNGTLEYPLLSGPISVAGLSIDEITRLLNSEIRVIKSPRAIVSVRDYASHAVVVGGLCDSPGRKILRREAMPLFAVLAEALVRPEATAATILRNGKEGDDISLKDEQGMATLVMPGDLIRISGAPVAAKKFLYVGGEVASPGEKTFREGMTLTQALLSAGGASGKTIKIARRNSGGYLSTKEYNLRSIEDGKTPDPVMEAGDRIEVRRGT